MKRAVRQGRGSCKIKNLSLPTFKKPTGKHFTIQIDATDKKYTKASRAKCNKDVGLFGEIETVGLRFLVKKSYLLWEIALFSKFNLTSPKPSPHLSMYLKLLCPIF